MAVATYQDAPPKPLGTEELSAALMKAGVTSTAQEFFDRRDAVATLVSNCMFQSQILLGSAKKGDYLEENLMKSSNVADWLAFEKKVWQPFAEAMIKDGVQTGWSVNVQVMPGGAGLEYQGVTIDTYPTWEAVFKGDPSFMDRFKKVHPEMDPDATFAQLDKVRTQSSIRLFVIEDFITSKK